MVEESRAYLFAKNNYKEDIFAEKLPKLYSPRLAALSRSGTFRFEMTLFMWGLSPAWPGGPT